MVNPLINTLLGEDRLLTGPEAGIQEIIAAIFYMGRDFKLVDRGYRRQHVVDAVEKLMVNDADAQFVCTSLCVNA